MRDLSGVVQAIKNQVPENVSFSRHNFLFELNEVLTSARYAAPEMMPELWGRVAKTLNSYLGVPNTAWKILIADIFTAKVDYREYIKLDEEKNGQTIESERSRSEDE